MEEAENWYNSSRHPMFNMVVLDCHINLPGMTLYPSAMPCCNLYISIRWCAAHRTSKATRLMGTSGQSLFSTSSGHCNFLPRSSCWFLRYLQNAFQQHYIISVETLLWLLYICTIGLNCALHLVGREVVYNPRSDPINHVLRRGLNRSSLA